MNDMQKLAFEIGRQIELEKLAVLAKARKAVKTYWGHLSGKTLKDARKDRERTYEELKNAANSRTLNFKEFQEAWMRDSNAMMRVAEAETSQTNARVGALIGATGATMGGAVYAANKYKGNKK